MSGELTVAYSNKAVFISGNLVDLPYGIKDGGIHVHVGSDCTDYNTIGGHLFSNFIDGWAYPDPTTYDTDADGTGMISVMAKSFVLSKGKGTAATPAVEGRCIVLHGVSKTDMAT